MADTRITNQRRKILDYLKSVEIHPSAEQVYAHVKKTLPQITLATVYRNLNLLSEQGIILRHEINKEYRYDACTGKHQHCVCEKCGRVVDIFQPEITTYAASHLKAKGFKLDSCCVMFKGLCNKCTR